NGWAPSSTWPPTMRRRHAPYSKERALPSTSPGRDPKVAAIGHMGASPPVANRREWSTMKSSVRALLLSGGLAAALGAAACGSDAPYPSRPITMVVPWGAGGGTDAVARVMAASIERDLGQPVNVVNRTGGSG